MVETAVRRPRRHVGVVAALLAVGVLIAMTISGHLRESKQFVKFVPAGVMPETPAEIDRLEIRTGAARWEFRRGPGEWRRAPGNTSVPPSLARHLDNSIKFMHVSAPVRVMQRDEWAPIGLGEFGLDPPGYTAVLYRGATPVLGAAFGVPNPEKVLQYMKLDGRDQVFLMPRFIGEEWEHALREAAG